MLETYKKSLDHTLINPESSKLIETADKLDEEDQCLFASEYLRLFDLCRDSCRRVDLDAYEFFEPVIIKEFTEKYGRA